MREREREREARK